MIALIMVLLAAAGTVVVGLLFIYVLKHAPKSNDQGVYLTTHGIKGQGQILAVEKTDRKLDGTIYPIVKLTLTIILPGKPSYPASTEVPVSYRDFPAVGMDVNVLVHPKKKNEFIIVD